MSANIYWLPIAEHKNYLGISAPSSFSKALNIPREFDESDIQYLEGFAAGAWSSDWREAINMLIEAIAKYKAISVNVEY